MVVKSVWKYPKKHNKIKEHYITCSHIWHVDISYWLGIHSMKFWWRYVLPNANGAHFCVPVFRHRVMLPSCPGKTVSKIKNPPRKAVGWSEDTDADDRQTFLRIVGNMFIYGPFWSRTFFFGNRKENCLHRFIIKINQNWQKHCPMSEKIYGSITKPCLFLRY